MLTVDDILTSDGRYKARGKQATAEIRNAATILAVRVTELLALYGKRPTITSGYRTPVANKAAGGAKASAHLEGRAVDFADRDRHFGNWCLNHLYDLERIGLWIEDPLVTTTWVHLQSRPAGRRVFKP